MTAFKHWLGLAVLLALTVAIYVPGLEGPFLPDDREVSEDGNLLWLIYAIDRTADWHA